MQGIICIANQYEFEGVRFEIARGGEPFRLRKDGEPYKRMGTSFYDLYDRFRALTEKEKQDCKIQGGCYSLNLSYTKDVGHSLVYQATSYLDD